jgi:type I restriction enzyme, S subunit
LSGAKRAEDTAMSRQFNPYPTYKESNIEWLGKIPMHWGCKRLKFVAPIRVAKLDVKPDETVYVGLEHVESWTGRLVLDTQPETVDSVVGTFRAGDVLFGKLRPYLAKTASPDFDGVCTSEILALRPNPGNSQRYVMFSLLNAPYIRWLDSLTFGTKMPRVSPEHVSGSFVSVPPEKEQRDIATFLDRETSRIDELIKKKERLIELLHEQRTALITRAVTKGLDPNVPMRDSGIEWLGRIPAHWETLAFRRLIHRLEQGWSPIAEDREASADEWAVIKLSAVHKGQFVPREHKALPPELAPDHRYEIQDGDFLLTRANTPELVGDVCVVAGTRAKLMLSDLVYRIALDTVRANPVYLAYWLTSRAGRYQIEVEARGSSQSMVKVSQGLIRAWLVALPPNHEQRVIVTLLDRETTRIDALIAKINEAIDRLKELHTALISAAVTGKIDVREEVA